jgi:hypothetical protein
VKHAAAQAGLIDDADIWDGFYNLCNSVIILPSHVSTYRIKKEGR